MRDYEAHTSSPAWSFLLGALAGATVAVLFAPLPGREARERVQRRVRATAAGARELQGRLMERGERVLRATSQRADAAANALSERRRRGNDGAQPAFAPGAERYS